MSKGKLPAPPEGYADWLTQLKGDISQAGQRAALAVNTELVRLYHRLGSDIRQRQQARGWGAKVIERLARDLTESFPEIRGFSSRNLKYMAFFAEHCPNGQFGQQAAAQLPWLHVVTLLTKLDSPAEREWYAQQTIQQGWSRSTLELNIKSRLQQRQSSAESNFVVRLPAANSAFARETLKDPYLFDFLGLGHDAQERDIEARLIRHITRFCWNWGLVLPSSAGNIAWKLGETSSSSTCCSIIPGSSATWWLSSRPPPSNRNTPAN